MEFLQCKPTGVKADIASGELKLTFSVKLNDENMEAAEALALYVDKDDGKVELRIIPQQPPLKGLLPTSAGLVAEEKDDE